MAKVEYYSLSDKSFKKMMDDLYEAIANLKTQEEVKNFFKELLTLSEFVMVGRRLQIAKMLLEGSLYEEIMEKMRVGSTTIQSVDRWLNVGLKGYRTALKKVRQEKGEVESLDDLPFTLTDLRKKYPAHFWLIHKIFG